VIVPCDACTETSPCFVSEAPCWSRRNRREALAAIAAGLDSLRRRAVAVSVGGTPKVVAAVDRAEKLIEQAALALRMVAA
jgi:hypothetical protein